MSIGEAQNRITAIQAQISMLSVRAAAPVTTPSAASGTQFAAALDQAVAAQSTSGTAATQSTSGAADAQSPSAGSGAAWVKPVSGRVTSGFGPRWGTQHEGMDIAAATGTPIRAMSAGVVRRADWNGGYGNAVIIDHGNGISTLYGHNSALNVKPGQRVNAGDVIAKAGSTGDSTGPHLHLEVRVNDKQIDPRPWLAARGVRF